MSRREGPESSRASRAALSVSRGRRSVPPVGDAEDLISAALAGDRVALGAFIRETQADVWRYCAYLARGLEPDDLVQETFLRAPGAAGVSGPRPGLRPAARIARRVCADAIRSAQRRRRIDALLTRAPAHHPDVAGHVTLTAIVSGAAAAISATPSCSRR